MVETCKNVIGIFLVPFQDVFFASVLGEVILVAVLAIPVLYLRRLFRHVTRPR